MKMLIEKERLEGSELIQTPENDVSLQDAAKCINHDEKLPQREKQNAVNITYHQGYLRDKLLA